MNGEIRNVRIFVIVAILLLFFADNVHSQTTVISSPFTTTISTNTQILQNNNNLVCTNLSYDLFQGLSDKVGDESVTKLQNYLYKSGYLKASSNGYFGPATLTAVKNYQVANNISNTGRVGPATRKSIRDRSCNISNTASVINSVISSTPTPKAERVNSDNQTVNYPQASSTLVTDIKTSIRWVSTSGAVYGLILEDKDGVGVGHISQAVIGDAFDWTVGKVYSSRANDDIYIEPGIYRIRISGNRGTTPLGEQYSGLFTITGKKLEIESINPNFIYAKKDSYIAMIGTGYDSTTQINFDINNSSRKIKPNYISEDGKVLVFRIPSYAPQGQYSLNVFNTYASGATSTPSNSVNLLIKD